MPFRRLSLLFLLWTAPIGLLLLIIVSFFDGCYKDEDDNYGEFYDSEEKAEAAGLYGLGCAKEDGEILEMSNLRRVPKVEVPGFFPGGRGLQGEKRKESLMDSQHFRRSQAPFLCRKRRARRL